VRAQFPFTVVFYGSTVFCGKTAQLSETPRESVCLGPSTKNTLHNIAKSRAKFLSSIRNPLLYPAELRAQLRSEVAASE
jgi:hypothetical protein